MPGPDTSEVAEEYRSSLKDLTINSKPLITMLTMLADENRPHAAIIVKVIEEHIHEVSGPQKLPVMYLIDSIMKNVGQDYIKMFGHNIISTFSCVFEKVDERTRKKLYELRHTWNEVFPKSRLYGLDVKVQSLDPAWPLPTGPAITSQTSSKPNIHINPNIIKPGVVKGSSLTSSSSGHKNKKELEILKREEQILELERQKLMLEKKKILLEQSRQSKSETKVVKPEPEKPIAKTIDDPSISSERRSEFLRSYKIKKKSQNKEESQVSSTIHVDPRRVHQVLPVVAASSPVVTQDPRRINETTRDPRLTVENNRDPRITPESSRDPRLNSESSRDPRLNSTLSTNSTKAAKPSEAQVTSSRDPRVAVKEVKDKDKDKVKEREQRKSKKETPVKPKKEKEVKPSKSEARSTRSLHRAKEKEKKEKESPVSSSSLKSNITHTKKSLEAPAPVVVNNSTTSFKSNRRNKQRTYKQRTESPVEEPNSPPRKKRSYDEILSDSDDSDHYQANRPNPALYNKSAKKPEVSSPATSTTGIGDTDYRQFTSPPKRPATNENVSPPKKDTIIDEKLTEGQQELGLFSKKDVDYRQLLPRPGLLPTPGLPAAFKMMDQDDRNPGSLDHSSRDPLAPLSTSDQDANISHPKGVLGPPGIDSPAVCPIDPRSRKHSFNSPHAASWEKFREKNPEFKEYQRQASMSEADRSFNVDEEDQDMPFCESHSGPPIRGRSFRSRGYEDSSDAAQGRHRDGRRLWGEEEEDGVRFQGRSKAAQENFKMILKQALEQRDRGEISENQYQNMANKLRLLTEQEQIREARERERLHPRSSSQSHFSGNGSWSSGGDSPASVSSSGPPPGAGCIGPGVSGLSPSNIPSLGRGRGSRDGHLPFTTGSRGGRGTFMGPTVSPAARGMGRAGRGGPGIEDDGWGRGGIRGRGRRGRGGHQQDDRSWPVRESVLEDEWTGEPDLPYVAEETLKAVARDAETRTIDIDGIPREIRTYGENAIILLDWNDPRILTFGDGHCNIVFDEGKFVLPMRIREDYKEFSIAGETHHVKLGVPTQELMLDGRGYQCFFGGKPITVHLAGQPRTVSLDGKPPNVNIGPVANREFLAGKIQLVINAKKVVNLFLDAKPQRFFIDGKPFVIQFIDALRAVTINNIRFPVEFGGLPLSISVRGYRRFLRFTSLPPGVVPGQVAIRGMESENQKLSSLPGSPAQDKVVETGMKPNRGSPSLEMSHKPPVGYPQDKSSNKGVSHPSMGISAAPEGIFVPLQGPPSKIPTSQSLPQGIPPQRPIMTGPPPQGPPPQGPPPQGPPPQGPPPHGPLHQGSLPTGPPPQVPSSHTPLLSQAPPTVPLPAGMITVTSMVTQLPPQSMLTTSLPVTLPNMSHPPPSAIPGSYMTSQLPPSLIKPSQPPPPVQLDLNALLENLTRTGLIDAKAQDKSKNKKDEIEKKKEEEEEEKERERDELISFEFMFNSENLRRRRKWLIESIYRGMQCSSCGLRYPPEQTLQYSHHLDWHFRQNRRQQESTKKANTRKFYFSTQDWLQYEEIEDVEERVPSMFENEGLDEAIEAEESEEPSVAVSSEANLGVCPTCHDTFSQFFHQETEEWRFHNAIQIDGINYHPACHQDMLRAEAAEKEKEEKEKQEKEEEEKSKLEKEEEEEKSKLEKEEEEKGEEMPVEEEGNKEEEKEGGKEDEQEGEKADKDKQKAVDGDSEETPMDSQTSVTEKVDAVSQEMQLPVQIKEEPMDVEEIDLDCVTSSSLPEGMMIKQEVKKEPPESNEDDILSRSPEEDDDIDALLSESNDDHMWETPIVSVNAAETDIASSIDGNTELSAPDTTRTKSSMTKIKLNMSKPTLNNNNENNNEKKKNDNCILNSNNIEEEIGEFVPPPFTVDYDLKPGFKGVELTEQPMEGRGVEISGLCSIM